MDEIEKKAELEKEYQLRFSGLREYRNEVWKILTREYFQKFIPPDATILDLGCGFWEFINNIRGRKKIGMDLNPGAARWLHPDVTFLNQDCSERWEQADESLDVVFTSNFLEHLPSRDHLRRALAQAKRCLKPGGLVVCIGPNIKYLGGRYWDFWDHRIQLTELSLKEALEIHAFTIETLLPKFLPYSMSSDKHRPLALVKPYLRFPLLWKIFGKQFVVTARKVGAVKH